MAINNGRVIAGGLLAGLIINVLDTMWNLTVLAGDNEAMVDRLGLDPVVLTSFFYAIPWMVVNFVIGPVIVWNYAAMRPRLGAGPRTAILAGLVPYVAITAVLCGFAGMGVFTVPMVVKSSALALLNVAVASMAGAWMYKEYHDPLPASRVRT